MIPNINPKMMEKAMKKMGIKQEEIDAREVVITCYDKKIVISNPQVSKIKAMGQESFQVTGEIFEQPLEKFSKDDINTVMEQAQCSEEVARQALEETNDIAGAILKLKEE